MDIAIVTGAETPLGLRLIEDLIRQGCRVHGIGNNFSHVTFADKHFVAHAIDLSDLAAVARTAESIIESEKAVHILIHAIDVTPGASFEKLPVGNLEAILKIGLLGPVMLTRMMLPNLLRFRGQLINIIPANKSGHIASAVNALIEGGLREMNTALFDQARDAGLRVTNLILRQNTVMDDTTFADKQLQTRIDPEHVARTVEQLLNPNEPNIPNEITLYPRLSGNAEEALPETILPLDPYNTVVLPPKAYAPPEQEAITTRKPDRIERTIPYTDEEMEEKIASAIEDYELHPERYNEPKRPKKNKRKEKRDSKQSQPEPSSVTEKSNQPAKDSEQNKDRSEPQQQTDQSKPRRSRNRRGGRSRNREQQDNQTKEQNRPNLKETTTPTQDNKPDSKPTDEGKPQRPTRRIRNRSRKPVVRPEEKFAAYEQAATAVPVKGTSTATQLDTPFQPGEVVLTAPQPPQETVKKKASTKVKQPSAEAKQLELVSETPPAKKKVTKKAAKKATKKVPSKKVATKKTATKKAAKKTVVKKAAKKAAKKAVKKPKVAE
jgi:NAD(P)-dependent dehydrogenase (short-subunit alcohol dehydrogenase family)